MSDHLFGLTDPDFWDDPMKPLPRVDGFPPKLGPAGILIDAPRFVSLGARQTLPVVARHTQTLKDAADVSFRALAVLAVVDVDRNQLHVGPALDKERWVREERTAPAAEPPAGMTSAPYLLDARARTDLPWQPSKLVVTVLLRDGVSNRVTAELGSTPGAYDDPEVKAFLEAQRGKTPPAVSPEASWPYPAYRELPNSPDLPDEPGIALAADRVSVLGPDSRAVVRGAFRLPVWKEDRVAPSPDGPAAVLGIHLLALGADTASPIVISLRVPSFDPLDAKSAAPLATGHFAIDLLSYRGVPWRDETYFLYAFSREFMAGPVPAALVRESMLPPGAR